MISVPYEIDALSLKHDRLLSDLCVYSENVFAKKPGHKELHSAKEEDSNND
jgi:hypothetical protein